MANDPGPAAGEVKAEVALALPVVEERLLLGTRRVDTGRGVRVSKSVAERPYELVRTLRHERVEVRRIPVDELVAPGAAPAARREGDTLIIPVLEEVLVVEKRLRLREEVRITTVARDTAHRESGVLRSEHVSVEALDEAAPDESIPSHHPAGPTGAAAH